MTFPFTRTAPDFSDGTRLKASELNAMDLNLTRAVDGYNGGSYTLQHPLSLLGAETILTSLEVVGTITADGNINSSGNITSEGNLLLEGTLHALGAAEIDGYFNAIAQSNFANVNIDGNTENNGSFLCDGSLTVGAGGDITCYGGTVLSAASCTTFTCYGVAICHGLSCIGAANITVGITMGVGSTIIGDIISASRYVDAAAATVYGTNTNMTIDTNVVRTVVIPDSTLSAERFYTLINGSDGMEFELTMGSNSHPVNISPINSSVGLAVSVTVGSPVSEPVGWARFKKIGGQWTLLAQI